MLYLIPTPIAENALHTLPEQVLEVVRRLDCFVVERAKTARQFVKAAGHQKPMSALTFVELPQDGGLGDAETLLQTALTQGSDVGVLSEAGCPGVADPGAAAVAWAHRMGMAVTPLVGPSSILLALMASGCNGQAFSFHGYLSAKRPELAKDLRRLETTLRQTGATQLFIETPYRSQMVLEVALETLSADTFFGVTQDLSGDHQRILVQQVKHWKSTHPLTLAKAPAVFLLGNPQINK